MAIYYSASARGFYTDGHHAERPPDAIEITEDGHRALLAAQTEGAEIVPDENGRPTTRLASEPTEDDLRPARQADARARLALSDLRVLRLLEAGSAVPEALRAYREHLRRVVRGEEARLPDEPAFSVSSGLS